MELSSDFWKEIESILQELHEFHQKKLLECGQRVIPTIIEDDLLQPNDFLELELHPYFRYEEGVLAGIKIAQMALQAWKKQKSYDS